MEPMKVLIVGGGIAGPALAHLLSRIGLNITLIERSSQIRASGQQIDLRCQGVHIMKKLGIEPAVRAARVHESGTQIVDLNGKTKAFFPAMQTGGGQQSITSEYEIMRPDLVKILYGLTEKSPNVHRLFGTTVASFTQDDEAEPNGKVHVNFHDGRKEDYDLVVGADGTGSWTRKTMLGDALDPRHPMGGSIAFFSIPSNPTDSDRFTLCHLGGRPVSRIIGTRKDCPELTRVIMMTRGTDAGLEAAHKSGRLADLKKAWSDLYQGGGWECERFMGALRDAPEANDLYSTPFVEVRLPKGSWSKGRVVLVGDAAHSSTADGYGTTWGMVGAYILAGEIATQCRKEESSPTAAILQAVRNYEETFRPIATANQGGSQWFEKIANPSSGLGISILHMIAKVASRFQLEQIGGLAGKTAKWQLPEFPELEKALQ